MSWQDSLVAIHTPTTGGRGNGLIGTGVQIGNDLVLTARHVVRPEKRSQKPIKLYRWYAEDENRTAPELSDEELIVWESVDYDVALLRCPQLAGIPAMLLNPYAPRDLAEFVTAGFPQAAMIDEKRKPSNFIGKLTLCADIERYFEALVSADKQPDQVEGWRGGSGMPVIVNGRIVGVFGDVTKGTGNGSIRAAPVWKLWKDEQFRALVPNQTKAELYLSKLETEIAILADMIHDKDIHVFLKNLGTGLAESYNSKNFRSFVDEIVIINKNDIINIMKRFQLSEHNNNSLDFENQFQKTANVLWPIIFCRDTESAKSIYDSHKEQRPILIDGKAGSETMAELLAAFSTGRPTDFLPREKSLHYPAGRNWIPINFQVGNIESGIVTSVKVALKAMASINQDSIREGVSPEEVVKDFFWSEYNLFEPDIATINILMKQASERGEALPYLACALPSTPNERDYIIGEFRELQKALPLLTIICLDRKKRAEEMEYLAGFNVILP